MSFPSVWQSVISPPNSAAVPTVMLPRTSLPHVTVTPPCIAPPPKACEVPQFRQQRNATSGAVRTVMLVTTSLVYVLLNGLKWTSCIYYTLQLRNMEALRCETGQLPIYPLVINELSELVYAYNFCMYLITGRTCGRGGA